VASNPRKAAEGCVTCQILIVDDSALIRGSIRSVIEDQTGWRVCGEAENGEIAVQKVSELNPTLVILDFQMPVMNGLEAAREISRIAPRLPMLMFTMHRSEQLETAAKAVGISCVVSKSGGQLDDLISSITNILQEVRAAQTTKGESAARNTSQPSMP
jgi:DNA-binding NarL/FixJ family response regulator